MSDSIAKFWDNYDDYVDLARMMGRTPLDANDDWQIHEEVLREELRDDYIAFEE